MGSRSGSGALSRRRRLRPIKRLIDEVRTEAARAPFPVDEPVYRLAGRDPAQPILYAGRLNSCLCVMGRDLGKEEVSAGEPLCGAAGLRVREGLYRALHRHQPRDRKDLQIVLQDVLLTNIVPFKPPANAAYKPTVAERFRPFIEQLLVLHWRGDQVLTLGNEAFAWFAPYPSDRPVAQFPEPPDRYRVDARVDVSARDESGRLHHRQVVLRPLPHPSPLNVAYYTRFPELLRHRLREAGVRFAAGRIETRFD